MAMTTSKRVREGVYPNGLKLTVPIEFRRHAKVDNPVWIIGFLSQWKVYLDSLPDAEGGSSFRGKRLDPTKFEKVRGLLPCVRPYKR